MFMCLFPIATMAQTYSVTFSFPAGASGAFPFGTISRDADGNLYGTTFSTTGANGGSGAGVVYSISSTGSQKVLHTFAGAPNDGANPLSGVIHSKGVIYAATTSGGNGTRCTGGCGVMYTLSLANDGETILHNFAGGADGANPVGRLIIDPSNNVYGTTQFGGSTACPQGCGIVYEITAAGKEIVGHRFSGPDGKFPLAGLLLSGSVAYGTTSQGGASGFGTVYKIDTTGKLTTLYSFKGGTDGAGPAGTLVQDHTGNLYGATYSGGGSAKCSGGCGTLFKIATTGKETVLYTFTGAADGANPLGNIVMDLQDNFFGVTYAGGIGSPGLGVIFEQSAAGVQTVVHSFAGGTDGQNPYGGLLRDNSDNLYGTAVYGGDLSCGANGCGLAFVAHP
jgi:uncharacterized repeat protein (TIGR03803 family)